MKKFLKLFTFLVLLLPFMAQAQILEPVQWTVETEKLSKNEYNIVFKAEIEDGWHLYSQNTPIGGPMPLYFDFVEVVGAERIGEVVEPEVTIAYNDVFEIDEHFFEKEVIFKQTVKLLEGSATISGAITGQACKESCVQLAYDFEVQLGEPAVIEDASEQASAGGESLIALIIEAIIWGFAALMTPCVFPMIPMTVSFFLHGSESKAAGRFKAIMYYVFIIALYTLPIAAIIMITRIIGGDSVTADIFNWISTSWVTNILFFVVFMVFAASFFGAFEIVLPSSLVNKSDSKTGNAGLGGVFFMALTLVLVSFACTGPIVGTALIQSLSGEFWAPILTMLAFSVVFALPFTLFALFPSWLKQLPKSGGWLNSVKVVLGFIEVALGLKFLMTADQTMHWGLLDREVYLAIWIVVFTLLGFYLLGKLRFAHDDEVKHISVFRLTLAIGVFSFVVYMIPGMFGAPLNAISGYIPPMSTQDYQVNGRVENVNAGRKYADFLHLPHQLEGHFDFEEAIEDATKQNKPIFVDVTGHACNNCREMETMVWSNDQVLPKLRDEFVICALYVDDMTKVEGGKRLGSINAAFAQERWKVNAQPAYILLSPDGEEVLAGPRGYNTDIDGFLEFLQRGIDGNK